MSLFTHVFVPVYVGLNRRVSNFKILTSIQQLISGTSLSSLSVCHLKPCSVSPKYWLTCPLALLTSWKVCLWQLQNMCKEFLVDCWSVPSALLPHHDAHSSPKGVRHRCMSAFLKRKSNSKILSPSSCSTLKSVSFLCTKRIVWHNFFQRVS